MKLLIAFFALLAFSTIAVGENTDIDPELRSELRQAANLNKSFDDPYVAQVWLVDMSSRIAPYIKDPKERVTFLTIVHEEATLAGLSPELVLSVVHIESLFNRYAISRVGARGLMQVMPFWKKEIGREEDNLFDMRTNLRYGCTILAHYIQKEDGNIQRALARYNGSTGKTWYPSKVLVTWEKKYFVTG
ncbi:lytic transglycosylase domain-containing protein [Gynuella sp.]|uniref:lytic transglycosylase domain-containing protein n=1 Tax=Gynuella sp. TaxID=2969146 RepID=UPI003D0CDBE5